MQTMYYIGLDVHKRTISYCVKDGSGTIHAEGARKNKAEGPTHAAKNQKEFVPALLRSAPGELLPS